MASKTILLVEDDQDILKLLQDSFEEKGINVVACGHPQLALKVINKFKFDCIVSDIIMPEMDGISLVKKIKENHIIPFLFFITAYSECNRDELNKLNPNAIIFKPFDIDETTTLIKTVISKN